MRFFRRTSSLTGKDRHPAPEDARIPVSVETGPKWMPEDDWRARLATYRKQDRSDAEILGIKSYLEKRGPRKPRTRADSALRAQSLGMVSKAEYMDSDAETRALAGGADGLPDARLQRERDRLLVVTSDGWVNPKSRIAHRAGLYSFTVAGTSYHEGATARDFTLGSRVRLVREPDNVHDANAIAVYADHSNRIAGYVPKGQARRLASLLDAGVDMVAITVRGSDSTAPQVLACERKLYEHLTR